MKIYRLRQKQFLPITLQEAWDFFSDPHNLEAITPGRLRFRILSVSRQGRLYPGQLIRYRIRILPLVWVNWLTEITAVKEGEYFIDDQRSGPYALWQHQHHFREVPGGVEMTDEVHYALPFGLPGRWIHAIFVGHEVAAIFAHRRRILEEKFTSQQTTIPA